MRARALAGIAVAAWSKTALVASAAQPASASPIPNAVHTVVPSPVTPQCPNGPLLSWPSASGTGASIAISGDARSVSWKSCPAATLSLDATADNAHWKRIDSVHMVQSEGVDQLGSVTHGCLPGTWTYRVLAIADDGSYKSSQRATFTC